MIPKDAKIWADYESLLNLSWNLNESEVEKKLKEYRSKFKSLPEYENAEVMTEELKYSLDQDFRSCYKIQWYFIRTYSVPSIEFECIRVEIFKR